MTAPASPTTDREIVTTRHFDAPRPLVFAAWSSADALGRWWGPRGFTITTHAMDFRPGGIWRFTMHGPDGTDYPNLVRYEEIAAPERLAYTHGEDDASPDHFRVTVEFLEREGGTAVTMRAVFPTAADRDIAVKEYGAIEGANQTLDRLAEHLAAM